MFRGRLKTCQTSERTEVTDEQPTCPPFRTRTKRYGPDRLGYARSPGKQKERETYKEEKKPTTTNKNASEEEKRKVEQMEIRTFRIIAKVLRQNPQTHEMSKNLHTDPSI
ncbi:hypothetical protein KOW79_002929 [Hemibagrus wyckioides]|uniref:Uncharacterized protein n=1 Tax=Hemibagrus wyckioides TaxID=337641 RepID=A0A9D3SS17_9TELE|nr:hypothetical protein KOW79_002929 [Hemibagrus wyckioides]